MKNLLTCITLAVIILVPVQGCSSKSRTVETTETTSASPAYSQDPVVHKTTTEVTTEETDDDGCGGLLSCIVDGVGEIIALPFRLVGGLFRAIF